MIFDVIADLCRILESHVEDESDRTYLAWELLYAFNQVQGELLSKLHEVTDEAYSLAEKVNELENEIDRLNRVITNFVAEYGDIIKLVESQIADEKHHNVKVLHEESI